MATIVPDKALIESVPNFSEGRRPQVIAAIVEAIQSPGVSLLNYSSDWDHNRSVVTVAGAPSNVLEGLFRAVRAAATLINLHEHRGEHPRMGAADVVPLVPLENITLEECAVLAQQLGKRIGDELQLPVYLYESAALRPERRYLANVRRGEFEALQQEIHLEARTPDFGPARVGPAGAVIVGARPFLIAYNVYLGTSDVTIAKRIAAAIRERGGGLPAVRAMGLFVAGKAQISMNLVDYTVTPIHVVMEAIHRHAAAEGVEVEYSELVGLVPQDAMLQVAAHYLKLADFDRLRVIENALRVAGRA
jgi:glutamate formiminotransferase / 5-formyltetrahydrofolate cyclo-ligase